MIPKQPPEILGFFPRLDPSVQNPRCPIEVIDDEGQMWVLQFIYYNNKLTGEGTRNEYRLTGLTPYFRKFRLKAGDAVILEQEGRFTKISCRRKDQPKIDAKTGAITLKLSGAWTVIAKTDQE